MYYIHGYPHISNKIALRLLKEYIGTYMHMISVKSNGPRLNKLTNQPGKGSH